MAVTIQVKRGVVGSIPTLAEGELGFATDTKDLYVGDGAINYKISSEEDFTTVLLNKLNTIEASGDITDATNVGAAIHGSLLKSTTLAANDEFAIIDSEASDVLKKVYWSSIKSYIDGVAIGIDLKDPVRVATAASGTLASAFVNGESVDGITLVTGDRILLKDNGAENGIYVVEAAGAPARASDANVSSEVTYGMMCFVLEGTANANEGWMLTTPNPIILDGTPLTFTQFSSITGTTTFIGLTDTPANYGGAASGVVRVNAGESALEFVSFASTYLDDTAGGTNSLLTKAPTSNVMYDHGVATTQIHGAGANTLLHSSSTIDGGAFV
jgi:hypothetical protein